MTIIYTHTIVKNIILTAIDEEESQFLNLMICLVSQAFRLLINVIKGNIYYNTFTK